MVLVPYRLFMHLISGAAHSLHGSEREEWVLVPVRAVYADYTLSQVQHTAFMGV